MNFEKIKGAEIVLRANDLLDGESVAVPPGLGFEYVSAGDLKVAGLGSAKVIQSGLNYWADLSDEELSLLSYRVDEDSARKQICDPRAD